MRSNELRLLARKDRADRDRIIFETPKGQDWKFWLMKVGIFAMHMHSR